MYRGFAPVSTIVRYNRCKGFAKSGQVLCRACKVCKVLGKGGGGVRSYEWIGRQRGDGAAAESPSESPRPLTRPAPFDKGAFFLRGRSPREEPPHQGRWPRSRPEGSRKLAGGCPLTGGNVRPVGTLQASQARPAPLMGSLLRAAPEIIAAVKNNGGSGEPPTQR